jgi:hypothetical protein
VSSLPFFAPCRNTLSSCWYLGQRKCLVEVASFHCAQIKSERLRLRRRRRNLLRRLMFSAVSLRRKRGAAVRTLIPHRMILMLRGLAGECSGFG